MDAIKKKVSELEARAQKAENDATAARKKEEETKGLYETALTEVQTLKAKLNSLEHEIEKMNTRVEKAGGVLNENKSMSDEVHVLRNQLKTSEKEVERFEKLYKEQKEKSVMFEKYADEDKEQLKSANSRIAHLEKENSHLAKELATKSAKLEEIEKELTAL